MRSKKFAARVSLALIIAAVAGVVLLKDRIKELLSFNSQKVSINFNNVIYPATDVMQRKMPLSTLKKETELALYIGSPFKDFRRQDWFEFWTLVYAAFPKDEPPMPGLPQKVRQLTREELQAALVEKYPQPFSSFPEEYWKGFFDILFGR